MTELELMIMITLIATSINGLFDALIVAKLAGKRSKEALVKFLNSSEADPYITKIAGTSAKLLDPKITALEAKISASVPDMTSFENIPSALSELQENLENLPNLINEAVAGQLNLAIPILQDQIVQSMDAKLKSVKAVEAHKLNAALKQFGAQVDETTGEIEGALQEQMNGGADPVQLALMKLVQMPIPERLIQENPLMAQMLQLGKAQAVQMYQNGAATGKRVNSSGGNDRSGIFG